MMKKRLLSMMLVGTLAASMLAGCATESKEDKDNKESTEVSESGEKDKEDKESTEDIEDTEETADAKDTEDVKDAEDAADTEEKDSEEDVKYMVENEVIPAYEAYVKEIAMNTLEQPYSFIYLNDDAIPELVVQGDCEATGNMICTYIDNEVVALHTSRLHFAYIPKQNLLDNSGGNMGVYYDRIYSISDKDFELVDDGEWNEVYEDDEIVFEYSWNGQTVSSEEYNNCLAQVFDSEKATDSYDMTYYSTIREAYENMSVIRYSVDCGEVYQFEIMDDRLVVRTDGEEPISIGYPISSDCIWYNTYIGNEDEVSESVSYEEIKEHVDELRQDSEEGNYTCWNGLGVQIKNNEVTKVYIILQ